MHRVVIGCVVAVITTSVQAADTPLYQATPAWVVQADLAKAQSLAKGPLVIQDVQVRVEGDTVSTYTDYAMRIDSPQALTQLGTLTAQWMPDAGDLLVHRASLVREGSEIDLLKDEKFTVLRREQQLEQRTLTGVLTATMPLSGARVGDLVRLSVTTTLSDKALAGNVQESIPMPFIPVTPGVGRYRVTWPADKAITVSGGPRFDLPDVISVEGFDVIELSSFRPKPDEMPTDAPMRYQAPPTLQFTSFKDWQDVSRTLAPLYATGGLVAQGGSIAEEVERIAAESGEPLVRAAAALKLVQDRVAYLAQGMNGGNYTPQTPAKTWDSRYGDCKAKTLLLLAMLDGLGIAAEPVVVNSTAGDGIFEGLPMPGAFDHVLVRAKIDGHDLWLDGTSMGSTLASIHDVPDFGWVLPLRAEGAGLEHVASRAPAVPSISIVNRIDMSAGIDFPALFDLSVAYSGPMGAMLQQVGDLPDTEQRDQMIDSMISSVMGESSVFERSFAFDKATGVAKIGGKGMATSYFDRSGKRAEYAPRLIAGSLAFNGNRNRAIWRDIPVVLPGADRRRADITVSLPRLDGYSLEGASVHTEIGGGRVDRDATLDGTTLHIVEEVLTAGGEVAPADVAGVRAQYATLAGNRIRLKAPVDAPRSWDPGSAKSASMQKILDAYGRLIATNPKEGGFYFGRASLYSGVRDYGKVIADLDKAIELDGDADWIATRANARQALGDYAGAIRDAHAAKELDPSAARMGAEAYLLGLGGRAAEGLTLVESALGQAGDETPWLTFVKADLLARLDRPDEGMASLDELVGDRPGDATSLNHRCWYQAIWDRDRESMQANCDAAVTAGNYSAAALDSRGLANLRLGRLVEARSDIDAALARVPGQDQSLLVRGLVRQAQGDAAAGTADLKEALRRQPGLAKEYAAYGLLPTR